MGFIKKRLVLEALHLKEKVNWKGKENSKKLYDFVMSNKTIRYKSNVFTELNSITVINTNKKSKYKEESMVGMWGGEYLVDMVASEIISHDEIKNNPKIIEESFAQMPEEVIGEFSYSLTKKQIEDFLTETAKFKNVGQMKDYKAHYSINFEHGLTEKWFKKTLELFAEVPYELQQFLSIEIMEDGTFDNEQLSILNDFSEKNNYSFSLDDLTSGTHNIAKAENIENLFNLFGAFEKKLKFVKVDFSNMNQLKKAVAVNDDGQRLSAEERSVSKIIELILKNLKEFSERFEEYHKDDDVDLPAVVLESMPFNTDKDLVFYRVLEGEIKKIGYKKIIYQRHIRKQY